MVARKGNEVIYCEDIEGGFNVSPVGPGGEIPEHRCNRDELRFALNAWIEGRGASRQIGTRDGYRLTVNEVMAC